MSKNVPSPPHHHPEDKRKPGRPPTYVFSKPDAELSENERRLKSSVIKRRQRQNRSYHRKKRAKELANTTINELNNSLQSPPPHHTVWPPIPTPNIPPHSSPHKRQWSDLPPPLPTPSDIPTASQQNKPVRWPNSIPHHLSNSTFSSITAATASDPAWSSSSLPSRHLPYSYPQQTPSIRNEPYDSTKTCFSSSSNTLPVTSTYSLTTPQSHSIPISSPTPYINSVVRHPAPHSQSTYVDSQQPSIHSYTAIKPPHKPPAPIDEKHEDEDCLLEEMLNASTDRPIPSSVPLILQPPKQPPAHQDILLNFSTLPKDIADGLKHLVLFPASFDLDSALAIMGIRPETKPGFAADALQPLVQLNFIVSTPGGRYILSESSKSLNLHTSPSLLQESRKRFVSHFITKMERLGTDSVNRLGKDRLDSMKLYDLEQGNMRAALQMCHDVGGKKMVVSFLAKGATIMRYAIGGHERTEMFSEALREIEKMSEGERPGCEEELRILLALSEAHFDILAFDEAKEHLNRAIALMAVVGKQGSVPVSSSVLALLLLGELKVREAKYADAEGIFLQAWNSLKSANLQDSTFGVCCLLSLVSVYFATGSTDRALHTGSAAVATLRQLGFSEMPLYADALGTVGTVHMCCGEWGKAQSLFHTGLNIMDKWINGEEWENAPFQHCTFLDIFLLESTAQSFMSQKREDEANELMVRARRKRSEQRLPAREEVESSPTPGALGNVFSRLYTRHVY